MGWREALFWRHLMLLLLGTKLMPLIKKKDPGEGPLGDPTANMLLLAHPAPDIVPKKGLGAGVEKEDLNVLPAPCPAVQSQTLIPLALGLDRALHLRKGETPQSRYFRFIQHPDTVSGGYRFSFSHLAFLLVSSSGITPVTLGVVPAPHPGPPLDLLALCPAHLREGGGGTHILPLTPALGVAPGRDHNPLRDEHHGAEDCAGTACDLCSCWS